MHVIEVAFLWKDLPERKRWMPSHRPFSLFVIDMQQQSIRPLLLRCLTGPSGLAFSHDERIIYLAETGKNRILRLY